MFKAFIKIIKPAIGRFPRIAHTYRVIRDRYFINIPPVKTPFGFLLKGQSAMMNGTFEQVETAIIQNLLKKTDVFINIGANIGYYVCHALDAKCYVVAVEPLRRNLEYLMQNICANKWENSTEVHPVAISNKPGVLRLFGAGTGASLIPGWAGAPTTGGQLTPVNTLDNIVGTRFTGRRCLMLMDVEGLEYLAVVGATKFLNQDPKPICVVEIGIGEHLGLLNPHLISTFELFWRYGYEAWSCTDPKRLILEDEVRTVAKTGQNTLGTHNFIFCQPNSPTVASGA